MCAFEVIMLFLHSDHAKGTQPHRTKTTKVTLTVLTKANKKIIQRGDYNNPTRGLYLFLNIST